EFPEAWTESNNAMEMNDMHRSSRSFRLARAAARGVTLIEVLIVVAILSLIAAGVTVAVLPKFRQAQIDTASTNVREIRGAVVRWRANRGGDECPTISQLVQDKEIDSASKTTDPWDSPYKIECAEDETYVSSPGPDKKEGTKDDIIIPEKGNR
ncbi:MAG TPA: type II secretion system protein, partial [Polyangiaceae bacterium]|nr:type II secretion system protein [Polyangiaceae bacterium]